jgi:N-carbamoyl-L-amino-acid hydrolase
MSDFDALNSLPHADAVKFLSGLYEHSDWIVDQALSERPFTTVVALENALKLAVDQATIDQQMALICAHPPLTGKAKIDPSLAADSQSEQSLVGLDRCTPEQFVMLNELNKAYTHKFGWPFILAVKGPRGTGLARQAIIDILSQRIQCSAILERQECLGQIHRIAQLRLHERLGIEPSRGRRVQRDCESLTLHSKTLEQSVEPFLSGAGRAYSQHLCELLLDAGFDSVHIDASGNVIGRYHSDQNAGPYLLTSRCYNATKAGDAHDGHLGITVPVEVVRGLKKKGLRLNLGLEVIALFETHGVRFSPENQELSGLEGTFQPSGLCPKNVQGLSVLHASKVAERKRESVTVSTPERDPADYLGFVEVRVEQGSVLKDRGLALGLESLETAQLRLRVRLSGQCSQSDSDHTQPRQNLASAAAEIMRSVDALTRNRPYCAVTVSEFSVPDNSTKPFDGQCVFLLDLEAASPVACNSLAKDVTAALDSVCKKWGVRYEAPEVMDAPTAPSAAMFRSAWSKVTSQLGLDALHLATEPSHSTLNMNVRLPQAAIVLRRESHGISNDPLDSITTEDLDLAVFAFEKLCLELQPISSARN